MNNDAFQENRSFQKFFQNLSDPLSAYYDCTFLTYRRFFPDGTMIYYINNEKWCNYSFQHEIWASKNAINRIKKAYQQGSYYYIWPTSPNKNDPVYSKLYEYDIWKGISIYRRHGKCVEAFCFVSSVDVNKVIDLYVNNRDILDRFCQYFKNCAKDIIENSTIHCLLPSPVGNFIDCSAEIETISQDFMHSTPIKNYPLMIADREVFLTTKETECLFLLAQGRTMKEIANINRISARTVETHISNIKNKTECSSTSKLISYFQNSNVNVFFNGV